MRARRLSRRLVGLPLFLALVLVTTPALAALSSTTAPPSAQSVSSGTWRMVFSSSATPPSGTTGAITTPQNTTSYVHLVNTGATAIPGSYWVTVTATSSNGGNVTLTACVGGTWTGSNNSCTSSATSPVGSTGAVTRWTVASARPPATPALPAGQSVHVRVQNNSALAGLDGGTTTLSVSVAPR